MKTIADLITNDDYYLHHVERHIGYYSAKNPGVAVSYQGIYGKGYRVFIPLSGSKRGIVIYYFIKKEKKKNELLEQISIHK